MKTPADITTLMARKNFAELINHAAYGKARFTITRRNKKLAALVSMDDLHLLESIEDAEDRQRVTTAQKEYQAGDFVPWDKIKADLGLPPTKAKPNSRRPKPRPKR